MKQTPLGLLLLGMLSFVDASSAELCDSEGTPYPGYPSVNSDYFSPQKIIALSAGPATDNMQDLKELHAFHWSISAATAAHESPALGAMRLRLWKNDPGWFDWRDRQQHILQMTQWTERTVYPPEPDDQRPMPPKEKQALVSCRETIPDAERLAEDSNPSVVDPFKACSLLRFEKSCLTNTELPPSFNIGTLRKVIVGITASNGLPYCMGTLVQTGESSRLITSRHCFISRTTGKIDPVMPLRTGETLDRLRRITIAENDVKRLELPCPTNCDLPEGAYGPERDAISLRVTVKELGGAKKMPAVEMDKKLIGCMTDKGQDLRDACTKVLVAGVVPDLLAAKRLEAQATRVSVSGTWVDEVRWSRSLGGYTRIDYLEDNCAYYSSQTVGGFSGTPLLTRMEVVNGEEVVYIAGVHSGATSASEAAWPACRTSKSNPDKKRLSLNIADLQVETP